MVADYQKLDESITLLNKGHEVCSKENYQIIQEVEEVKKAVEDLWIDFDENHRWRSFLESFLGLETRTPPYGFEQGKKGKKRNRHGT